MQREAAGRFVKRLFALKSAEDRAALAALRRGLGKKPGTEAAMFSCMPWVPEQVDSPEYRAAFLIASLFALHPAPAPGGSGTFGDVMRRIRVITGSDSIERRFVWLMQSHPDDLPSRLRGCVALAESHSIPVDWQQLLMDLQGLLSGGDWADEVRKRWSQDFWAPRQNVLAEEQAQSESGGES